MLLVGGGVLQHPSQHPHPLAAHPLPPAARLYLQRTPTCSTPLPAARPYLQHTPTCSTPLPAAHPYLQHAPTCSTPLPAAGPILTCTVYMSICLCYCVLFLSQLGNFSVCVYRPSKLIRFALFWDQCAVLRTPH